MHSEYGSSEVHQQQQNLIDDGDGASEIHQRQQYLIDDGDGASEIHQQQQQQLIDDGDDDCCDPSVFTISNPQNNNYLYQYHSQQQQMFQRAPSPSPSHFTDQLLHPFQTFHQMQEQQLGFEVQSLCPTSHDPFFGVNFNLGLNENSANKDEHHHHQSPLMSPHCWRSSQEDSSRIKLQHQPYWCNSNSTVDKEAEPEAEIECNKNYKKLYSTHVMGTKYKHFGSELEAVYSLENPKINVETNNQIMGSGSAIIGVDLDHGSEIYIGEEASLEKVHEKKKRKRKMKGRLSSMVGFFEGLVKQVMDHQEGLHRKFLEVVQRMDIQKFERDEAWRREETAKYNRGAIARAREQAIALSREAMIISYIERITGQSINLPPRKTALSLQPAMTIEPSKELKSDMNSCRWPKAEVEALIQVRGSLESRFSEQGLKGPLWEEVSALMASMGYQRSAKRCKEKWENINKYFRKTKESGKKRSPQSKTCPYFDQLDQLYSRNCSNFPSNPDVVFPNQGYLKCLDLALDAARGPSGIANETVEFVQGSYGDERENQEDEDEDEVNAEENEIEN